MQHGGVRRQTTLSRYTAQLGRLVEQRMSTAALLAAKQEAEYQARQAHQAMLEAHASNEALREEIEKRAQVQSRLAYLASHDALTGLANRTLLREQLRREMEQARRRNAALALLYLDLDDFKDVNDTLGHAMGDALLKEVANRLAAMVRGGEIVARMGGDEFAILQSGQGAAESAQALAQRVIATLGQPVEIAERRLFIGVSVGITLFPNDGEDPDLLLKNADLAMYRAKQEGRNRYHFFDTVLNEEVHRRSVLEQALHAALAHNQLSLALQPQVHFPSHRIEGAEALVRWQHANFGLIPPEEFVPVAEHCGLINRLGCWVLRESCRLARSWDAVGLPPIRVAVNVSVAQLKGGDVPRQVSEILDETGLPPSRLELEITETGVMHDVRNAAELLSSLHALGVSLAIDDFGTGYSSLSYLSRLPVDRIKIDRSFVRDALHNEGAALIATTIVNLGRNLRLAVVAEGVETKEHADFVERSGCAIAQGFYYGMPMPPEQFVATLKDNYRT
jgi:diguanylate cyclase (GGDEF)-like protein